MNDISGHRVAHRRLPPAITGYVQSAVRVADMVAVWVRLLKDSLNTIGKSRVGGTPHLFLGVRLWGATPSRGPPQFFSLAWILLAVRLPLLKVRSEYFLLTLLILSFNT